MSASNDYKEGGGVGEGFELNVRSEALKTHAQRVLQAVSKFHAHELETSQWHHSYDLLLTVLWWTISN
jgi:hypothetical protein